MAGAPHWKVYNAVNEYVAACKFVEDAAAVVSLYSDGATIRNGHAKRDTVWTEGADGAAGESYDHVRQVVHDLLEERVRTSPTRKHDR